MSFPQLEISPRDREFRRYSREQRESVVMRYLFEGLSDRSLDEEVLGLDKNISKGFQSMGILKHYGLRLEFKGIFRGMTAKEALDILPNDSQYDVLYDIISGTTEEISLEPHEWIKGFTKVRLVKTRINQDAFRKAVLKAYSWACCITGISEPKLLRASHIKPWCESSDIEKGDVGNGLCLNSLHDAAFDTGLMTVDPSDFRIRLSSKIEDSMDESVYEDYFRRYDGTQINLPPENMRPKPEYLEYHKHRIFDRNPDYIRLELEIPEH
jgi:hypothetical protein